MTLTVIGCVSVTVVVFWGTALHYIIALRGTARLIGAVNSVKSALV